MKNQKNHMFLVMGSVTASTGYLFAKYLITHDLDMIIGFFLGVVAFATLVRVYFTDKLLQETFQRVQELLAQLSEVINKKP